MKILRNSLKNFGHRFEHILLKRTKEWLCNSHSLVLLECCIVLSDFVFPFIFNQAGYHLLHAMKPYQGVNLSYQTSLSTFLHSYVSDSKSSSSQHAATALKGI